MDLFRNTFDRAVWRKPLSRCVGNYLCVFNGVSGPEKEREASSTEKLNPENSDLEQRQVVESK